MLKPNQKIEILWSPQTFGFFRERGYEKWKKGETISVDPTQLPENSHRRIQVICDGEDCHREIGMEYRQYLKNIKNFNGKYYCKYCAGKTEEVKEKRVRTCREKYGVDNPMQVPEFKGKLLKTLCENDEVPTSSQQLKIYEILKEKYLDCQLNYSFSYLSLDCFLEIGGIKIDIEYDGDYWHQDKDKDDRRDNFLMNNNFKILRIKSSKKIPIKEEIYEAIDHLLKTDDDLYTIIMDDSIFYKET